MFKKSMNRNYKLTKKVGLFTNARDEIHIKEWASHHLLIGFDNIIIFDHKSKKSLHTEFISFDKRVKIINVSYMNDSIKLPLMNLSSNIAKNLNLDWMIYLDADEYIILKPNFFGIKHFLNFYNNAHSIGINWLMFGSNFLKKEPTDLLINSYTKSELNINKHVKTFVRPNEIINSVNPHYYIIHNKNKMIGINGKILTEPHFNELNIPFTKVPIYIAHYVNQSEETFIKRKSLPRDDTNTFRVVNSDIINNLHNQYNDVNNFYPSKKYSQNIRNFLSKYS
jgi:hypothetical protein